MFKTKNKGETFEYDFKFELPFGKKFSHFHLS